jgi:hypothetical protein
MVFISVSRHLPHLRGADCLRLVSRGLCRLTLVGGKSRVRHPPSLLRTILTLKRRDRNCGQKRSVVFVYSILPQAKGC